jgi:hypothetical protein
MGHKGWRDRFAQSAGAADGIGRYTAMDSARFRAVRAVHLLSPLAATSVRIGYTVAIAGGKA